MRIALVLAILVCTHASLRAAPSKPLSVEEAFASLIVAPHPDYSFEARKQRLQGSGIFELRFNVATGLLREIYVVKSTGHAVLDGACIRAFKQWKVKPHSVPEIRIPINFKIDG